MEESVAELGSTEYPLCHGGVCVQPHGLSTITEKGVEIVSVESIHAPQEGLACVTAHALETGPSTDKHIVETAHAPEVGPMETEVNTADKPGLHILCSPVYKLSVHKPVIGDIQKPVLNIMSPENNFCVPPSTPGLSMKMRGLFLEEDECLCSGRCDGGDHHHHAGQEQHRHAGEGQDLDGWGEEGNDECLCSVHCKGRGAHLGEDYKSDLALGIKYCPGLEPELPTYYHQEYKPRASKWKFTIFKPQPSILAGEERDKSPGGKATRETGRRGEGEKTTAEEVFLGQGGVRNLILDWEARVGGGEEEDGQFLAVGKDRKGRRASDQFRDTLRKFVDMGEGEEEKSVNAKQMLSFASISQNFISNSHTSADKFTVAKRKRNTLTRPTISGVVGRGGHPLAGITANGKRKLDDQIIRGGCKKRKGGSAKL